MKKQIHDWLSLFVGALILSLAINCFLVPVKISTGGVSGVATILLYLGRIPLSVTTFLINLVLLFFGYRMLSRRAIVKSFAGVLFLSMFLQLTEGVFQYREDVLISAIFGGVFAGIGVGLPMRREASTGGTDFAALMLHKRFPHISPTVFILVMDTAVIIASGIAFENVTVMFYSILSLYVSNVVIDLILVRGDFAKSVTVVSKKSEEISSCIMKELNRGVTALYSRGCYEKREGFVLFCIVREREVPKLMDIVKRIDPGAFTVISQVRKVRGEGFKRM